MKSRLPDISATECPSAPRALAWVGMQGIDLPITLAETGATGRVHARADVQVDLPRPQVKGIHMSRLHHRLGGLTGGPALSKAVLSRLLAALIESHADCGSRSARLRLKLELLVERPALVTQGLAGWKAYPLQVEASLIQGVFRGRLEVIVGYASTCPCSAALSRQLIGADFLRAFQGYFHVPPAKVADWLQNHATSATPHSQRSEARVAVELAAGGHLGALELVDRVEAAVGTPLQTAVKRADEQEFAARNGRHLMFVEDAARDIASALDGYRQVRVQVRHLESLHPHDAVAWVEPVADMAIGTMAEAP